MKIKMAVSPRTPETAEKRHWTASVIRAFGIVQVIGTVVASYFFLRPVFHAFFMTSLSMAYDGALLLSTALSILVGLLAGFLGSSMTFALATFLEDVHTIKNYLRDMHITGQYYDE